MHEESIYRILDAFPDENSATQVNRKESIRRSQNKSEFVLPTASTFISHSTVGPIICNLAGNKASSTVLKYQGKYSVFGPLKSSLNQSLNTDAKPKRHNLLPPLKKSETKENTTLKPPIPKTDEQPIMGLSSHVNFVDENRRQVVNFRQKKVEETYNPLKKKDYGKVPAYLNSIRALLKEDANRLQQSAVISNAKTTFEKYELPADELASLKAGLLQRHAEVTREYQGMAHKTKFASDFIVRKKERYEKELMQIEKDLSLLDGTRVFIDCSR